LVWLPTLSPASTLAYRRLAATVTQHPDGFTLAIADFAQSLGLGTGVGHNAPFCRTLRRLAAFGLARSDDANTYAVRRRIPPASSSQLRRFSPELRRIHTALLARHDVPGMLTELALSQRAEEITALMLNVHAAANLTALRAMAEADLRDVLPPIRMPTLLLYGEARQALVHRGRDSTPRPSNPIFVVLPGAGHLTNFNGRSLRRQSALLPPGSRAVTLAANRQCCCCPGGPAKPNDGPVPEADGAQAR